MNTPGPQGYYAASAKPASTCPAMPWNGRADVCSVGGG
jgi:hypothetical protein